MVLAACQHLVAETGVAVMLESTTHQVQQVESTALAPSRTFATAQLGCTPETKLAASTPAPEQVVRAVVSRPTNQPTPTQRRSMVS